MYVWVKGVGCRVAPSTESEVALTTATMRSRAKRSRVGGCASRARATWVEVTRVGVQGLGFGVVRWFPEGLVFKAHRLCVSLESGLESYHAWGGVPVGPALPVKIGGRHSHDGTKLSGTDLEFPAIPEFSRRATRATPLPPAIRGWGGAPAGPALPGSMSGVSIRSPPPPLADCASLPPRMQPLFVIHVRARDLLSLYPSLSFSLSVPLSLPP